MNVVSFDPQAKANDERKAELLEVLDEMRRRVEEGDIKEFVAASVSKDGDVQIHASVLDLPGGVGLFEIGKVQLINYGT
jgi:hypothetical protein